MARIVAEKSEPSFSQVIHSAGVRSFGEAQLEKDRELRYQSAADTLNGRPKISLP
jgi:hypothetical protein